MQKFDLSRFRQREGSAPGGVTTGWDEGAKQTQGVLKQNPGGETVLFYLVPGCIYLFNTLHPGTAIDSFTYGTAQGTAVVRDNRTIYIWCTWYGFPREREDVYLSSFIV